MSCDRRVEDKFRERAVDELAQNKSSLPANWLLYVLRLCQVVSHPFLLEKLKKVETDTPYIVQIGRWCEEKLKNVMGMGYDDIHGTPPAGCQIRFPAASISAGEASGRRPHWKCLQEMRINTR